MSEKCSWNPMPAGLKKMADGSSATPVKARPMPVARAPWVMTWNPEGVAGAAISQPAARRTRKTRDDLNRPNAA